MRTFLRGGKADEKPAEQAVAQAAEQAGRKRRRDAGQTQITARDRAVLPWVGDQYAVRLDQLQWLLDRSEDQAAPRPKQAGLDGARKVLARWEALGFAESRKVYSDQPRWLWLTAKGLARLERGYRYKEPAQSRFDHYYAVNQVRLYLEGPASPQAVVWRPEREIKPWGASDRNPHYADAEVEVQGRTVAIEVERTTKKPADLLAILQVLAAGYARTWYFVLPTPRPGLERALARMPEADRKKFDLLRLDTLL